MTNNPTAPTSPQDTCDAPAIDSARAAEHFLRDAGLPRRAARKAATPLFRALHQDPRDEANDEHFARTVCTGIARIIGNLEAAIGRRG